MKSVPSVAVVGRPNVGKSTLFNRITRGKRAIVHPTPGVTRDVQRGRAEWTGVAFDIIDTGGLFSGVDDGFVDQVERRAMEEALAADAMIFLTDGEAGLLPSDYDVAKQIRDTRIPVFLVVNKTEKPANQQSAAEFYKLGFENIYLVSAVHGNGVGDLLDDVVAVLPQIDADAINPDLKLAFVGMPNVGKSSMVNALLGREANIVDSTPGTTRDSIDIQLRWHDRDITLVDTAGIKRKSQTRGDGIMVLSALKSLDSIERCDVAILLFDASRGLSNQDVKVASYVHKAGRGVVVCFNKWDLVDKEDKTYVTFEREFRRKIGFMPYAPIMFVSALTHQRISKVLEKAWEVKEQCEKRVPTAEFNDFLAAVIAGRQPPFYGGGTGKIYYGAQVEISPPTFTLFVNKTKYFGRNYLRYLNNQVRKAYGFSGTVVRIKLAEKKRVEKSA